MIIGLQENNVHEDEREGRGVTKSFGNLPREGTKAKDVFTCTQFGPLKDTLW